MLSWLQHTETKLPSDVAECLPPYLYAPVEHCLGKYPSTSGAIIPSFILRAVTAKRIHIHLVICCCRWVLLQEGAPLTGEHYRELPATVREVFETVLYGDDGLSFLVDLGATQEYLLERTGNLYTLMHEGHEIKVGRE